MLLAGAPSELGDAVAERLLDAGAALGLPCARPWQVEKMQARHADHPTLVGLVPIGEAEAAVGFAKGLADSHGPIDALISVHDVRITAPAGRETAKAAQEMVSTNLLEPLIMVRAVLPAMRRRKAGRIILTGANIAEQSSADAAASDEALFAATKLAAHGYARTLAAEVAVDGVDVRVIAAASDASARATAERIVATLTSSLDASMGDVVECSGSGTT